MYILMGTYTLATLPPATSVVAGTAAYTTDQAFQFSNGFVWAPFGGGSGTVTPTTTTPIISPAGGSFSSAQSVTLTCVTAGATIYFTTDGTQPTTSSTIYKAPITVSASEVIQAIAVAPGSALSAVASASFAISVPTTATPAISPAGGSFTSTQSVTITCSTGSSSIFYTTDGSTPTASSTPYTGAISVSASETLKAIATSSGNNNSAVSSAVFTITTQAAAPTFSPAAGTYSANQNVTLAGPTGAAMYYTTDGTTPTYPPSGTTQMYIGAIPIPPSTAPVNAPTFSPVAGSYTGAQSVSIIGPAGSIVYYTLDGSTPTTASAVYSAAIPVSATETISAIATAGGLTSTVASALYTISSGGGGTGLTPVVSYPNFNSTTGLNTTATITGGVAALIPSGGSGHVALRLHYATLTDISGGFTIDYAAQFNNMTAMGIIGMALVIQNTQSPPGPAGFTGASFAGDANACGAGGLNPAQYGSQPVPTNSVAIKLDANFIQAYFFQPSKTGPSTTGYYENGGSYNGFIPNNDLQPDGIDFYAGNLLKVHVVYDGVGTIVQTITDTVTGAQSRMEWPSNVQNALSGNLAYIGFTSGHALNNGNVETPGGVNLLSFSIGKGYLTRLSQPTFSVASGQYAGSQSVTLSGPTGATIYYTTNGRMPTTASTQYTGPIAVSTNTVLLAIAIQSGFTDSIVAHATYRIGTTAYISFPSTIVAGTGLQALGSCVIGNGVATLTSPSNDSSNQYTQGQSGGLQWADPVPSTSFSAAFTVQVTNSSAASNMGFAYVLQNATPAKTAASTARTWPAGKNAIGGPWSGFGQGGNISDNGPDNGFINSFAIGFDLSNNEISMGIGGVSLSGTIAALNFNSGNPVAITVNYDGSNVIVAGSDSIAGTSFTHTFAGVSIPNAVGGNTAFAQITAGTFFNHEMTCAVSKWTQ